MVWFKLVKGVCNAVAGGKSVGVRTCVSLHIHIPLNGSEGVTWTTAWFDVDNEVNGITSSSDYIGRIRLWVAPLPSLVSSVAIFWWRECVAFCLLLHTTDGANDVTSIFEVFWFGEILQDLLSHSTMKNIIRIPIGDPGEALQQSSQWSIMGYVISENGNHTPYLNCLFLFYS